MEKVVCRIICKGDPELHVLPKFLDRWRQYTRKRQIWRYHLDYVNRKMRKGRDYLDAVEHAFKKMKDAHHDRRKEYDATKFADLAKQSMGNFHRLSNLCRSVDER
jgi:hypothetical protein